MSILFLLAFSIGNLVAHAATIANPGLSLRNQLNETVSANCRAACAQLSASFGDALHYPDNDNFTIWDAKQQEVRPACRVEPFSATEVAEVLATLVQNWCYFSVKGGGHSRHAGDSNSVGGVTIDLDRINSVEVAADRTTATVGGGATSLHVYQALEPYNLSFVGGRSGTVGVGGFSLGGGTSPFSNRYGWALDNVYAYEVVLANSTIVTVTENQHPDLYFALRGGGNNFGIVTTFTVRVFPQGPVFNAVVTYNNNQTEQVLDRVYDIFTDPSLTSDADMALDLYYSYNQANDGFNLMGTQRYARPVENPPVFQALDQIPPMSRTVNIGTMASLEDTDAGLGTMRHLFGTTSFLPSRALLSQMMRIFEEEIEAIKTVEGLAPFLICYPLSTNAIAAMKQRGGNALGIDQEEPLFIVLISSGWLSSEGDDSVYTMTKNTLDRINSAAQDLGVYSPYRYINYAYSEQVEDVFKGYGEVNLQRLKNIQRALDPDGVFTSHGLWKGFMKLL